MLAITYDGASQLDSRNREIGNILTIAREKQQRSVRECAALLGTSRRRYGAIERGEVGITFAELEVIAKFLSLSMHEVMMGGAARQENGRLVVRVRPGDRVQVEFVA